MQVKRIVTNVYIESGMPMPKDQGQDLVNAIADGYKIISAVSISSNVCGGVEYILVKE